jgi:hypothetical protein
MILFTDLGATRRVAASRGFHHLSTFNRSDPSDRDGAQARHAAPSATERGAGAPNHAAPLDGLSSAAPSNPTEGCPR